MKRPPLRQNSRQVKISAIETYFPEQIITNEQLDRQLGLTRGASLRVSGVEQRHFAGKTESSSDMAVTVIKKLVKKANLDWSEIDAIVCASFSYDQPLPYRAALIQKKLALSESGIACFDIEATCLSFVVALDLISSAIATGTYRRVLIVSSEKSTAAINWKQLESACLFGDGACAVVLEATPDGEASAIHASHLTTHSAAFESCQIEGGGAVLHARHYQRGFGEAQDQEDARFLFSMNGRDSFKTIRNELPEFVKTINFKAGVDKTQDYHRVVPHQASLSAILLLSRLLELDDSKVIKTVEKTGNLIAASIPSALSIAIDKGEIKRGDKILLLGTSAGLSIGGVSLTY